MITSLRTVPETAGVFRLDVVTGPGDDDSAMLFRIRPDGHVEQGAGWTPSTLRAVAQWMEDMGVPT